MKYLWIGISMTALVLLVGGCSSDQPSAELPAKKAGAAEHASSNKKTIEAKGDVQDEEKWVTQSNAKSLLNKAGINEPYHFLIEDLDHNGIPEVIADYGEFAEGSGNHAYGFKIFKQGQNGIWNIASEYDDEFINAFRLYGTIETPGSQKVLVGSQTVASATNMHSTMLLFRYDVNKQAIQLSGKMPITDEKEFKVNIKNNQISVTVLDGDGSVFDEELYKWESETMLRSGHNSFTAADWQHYFDKEFADKAENHFIKGLPYGLGSNIEEIKSDTESTVTKSTYFGMPALFDNVRDAIYEYRPEEDNISTIIYNVPNLNYDEMESIMGEPKARGILVPSEIYQEKYEFDDAKLYFESVNKDRNSGISKIILTTN